ncbi:MAG: hypothetical protein ACKVOU_14225 [Cytophagales bacterium]
MDRLDIIEANSIEIQNSLKEIASQQKKTDEQQKKTDAQLRKAEKILGNIGVNLGVVAEEYFFDSLESSMLLGNIKFDDIQPNVKAKVGKVQDEFDIVLYNGNSIALIEVKHKVHPNDIEILKTQKVQNFKRLFPYYADYKFYLGIAGFSIPKEIVNLAKQNGMAVLKQKGNLIDINDTELKAY